MKNDYVFYVVEWTLFGRIMEQHLVAVTGDAMDAIEASKTVLKGWKRILPTIGKLSAYPDTDPVELTHQGYLQKLAYCDAVMPSDEIV